LQLIVAKYSSCEKESEHFTFVQLWFDTRLWDFGIHPKEIWSDLLDSQDPLVLLVIKLSSFNIYNIKLILLNSP